MTLGIDRKKLGVLAGLLLVLGYFLYSNMGGHSTPTPAPAARKTAGAESGVTAPSLIETRPRPPARSAARQQDSRFTFKTDRTVDPASVDPTLRLDLLAKVQSVDLSGGARNLFQFGAAPLPKTPEAKIVPKPIAALSAAAPPADAGPPPPPPKPTAPPIPLKFYGYANQVRPGVKRAFFLDGDDIIVANEGDLIKQRYKVVRIGINSVVIEDTQFQTQQTLQLEEQNT